MIDSNAVYVIVARELKKFTRERSRLVSTLARPLIWLFLVGGGLSNLIPSRGGVSYMQFIFPGILGMTILFSSIFSAISIIWDKEFGYMKEILVAPVSRSSIVFGKALSGTLVSVLQVIIILLLYPFLKLHLSFTEITGVILFSFLLSFCLCNVGILIATFYDTFESFSVIMNFIVMPMFFLSGAMYPVERLPLALRWLAQINPVTYGVDGLKNIMFIRGNRVSDFPLYADVLIIAFCSLVFMISGTYAFKRRV